MIIIIKILKGDEYEIEVSDHTTIYDVKKKITKFLQIPMTHQKLLYLGRTLVDEKTIGSYCKSIKARAKLTLVVKEPEALKATIFKMFRKHYDEEIAEKMTNDFMDILTKRLNLLSLDDIENMAKYFLDRNDALSGDKTVDSTNGKPPSIIGIERSTEVVAGSSSSSSSANSNKYNKNSSGTSNSNNSGSGNNKCKNIKSSS